MSQAGFQELSVDVAKLAKSLADATGSLPSYDQRQYEQQLKGLEVALADLRDASVPKAKFAFKRKTPAPPISSTTNASPTQKTTMPDVSVPPPSTTNLVLSSRSFEYITLDSLQNSILQQDLSILDLDHCIVNLIPATTTVKDDVPAHGSTYLNITALHVRNVTDTVLLLPSMDGSILLHDLSRCTLVLGCHQFRMHTSNKVDIFLSIPSNPIIEHCSDIRFSGYPNSLTPSLDQMRSKHLSVQDFSHIRPTPSPHWSVLSDGDQRTTNLPLSPLADRTEISDTLEKLLP